MIIYPAIDIRDGKCVRLLKGNFSDETVYGDDPVEMAKRWEREGGKFLHVVDLDGAKFGKPLNSSIVIKIAKSVKIPVQTGGGLRDRERIEYLLEMGVNRVILGTSAVSNKKFLKDMLKLYGERIVLGIDSKDGYAAVEGWEKNSRLKSVDFAKEAESYGVKTIIFTEISRDGTLKGPDLKALKKMIDATSIDIIASGGVGSMNDIKNIKETGAKGVIVGKALYTGAVNLSELKEEA